MSRGKKLDIFVGADFDNSWTEVQSKRKSVVSNEILEPPKHFLFFKKEKRRGKTVTLVGEFHMPKTDTTATLKMLKKKLGCGGAYKDNFMEFQGELKDKLRSLLIKEGFKFRQGH